MIDSEGAQDQDADGPAQRDAALSSQIHNIGTKTGSTLRTWTHGRDRGGDAMSVVSGRPKTRTSFRSEWTKENAGNVEEIMTETGKRYAANAM